MTLLAVYALSFCIVALAMLGLAAGIIGGRPGPKGSCGRACRCARPRCAKKECDRHASQNP